MGTRTSTRTTASKVLRRVLTFAIGLVLLVGCRDAAIDSMSRLTQLASQEYAAAYTRAAEDCLERAGTREEYDRCMAQWNAGEDALQSLRFVTRTLDGVQGRRNFKSAACRWFDALTVVQAASPVRLQAVTTGLESRWRRRCT